MSQQSATAKSSEALRKATGRDYAEWFAALDAWGAPGRPFRAIAAWLTEDHGVSAWWAQKLIVEYEQGRGIREPGARPDGTFTGGASKSVGAPVDRVFAAFSDPDVRDEWLPDVELRERSARPGRSMRFDVADGSRVTVTFDGSGDKTQVAVEQERLPDAAAAESARTAWRGRLTTLKRLLEG